MLARHAHLLHVIAIVVFFAMNCARRRWERSEADGDQSSIRSLSSHANPDPNYPPELGQVFSVAVAFALIGAALAAVSMWLWSTYAPIIVYVVWMAIGATLARRDKINISFPRGPRFDLRAGVRSAIAMLLWPLLLWIARTR